MLTEIIETITEIPFYDAWPRVQSGLLEIILDDYELKDIAIYGVFPPGTTSSKKLRLLIDYLKDYFVKIESAKLIGTC